MRKFITKERSNLLRLILLSLMMAALVALVPSARAASAFLPTETDTASTQFVLNGIVEPSKRQAVSNRVSGVIAHQHVSSGMTVKTGDVLFTIDKKPFDLAVALAKAERQEAQARFELAKSIAERKETLSRRNAGTQAEAERALAEASIARAKLDQAIIKLEQAKLDLDKTDIRADAHGVVVSINTFAGQFVEAEAGNTLAEIIQLDPIRVRYRVSHQSRQKAMQVSGACTVSDMLKSIRFTVEEPDGSKHPHEGRVDFESALVDPQTGQIDIWGIIANPRRTLLPGLNVKVHSSLIAANNKQKSQNASSACAAEIRR